VREADSSRVSDGKRGCDMSAEPYSEAAVEGISARAREEQELWPQMDSVWKNLRAAEAYNQRPRLLATIHRLERELRSKRDE